MTEQVIETPTVTEEVSTETIQPEVITEVSTEVEPIVEVTPSEEVPSGEPTDVAAVESIILDTLMYGDNTINLTIPEEAVKMASDKGFKAEDLVTELFTNDFKFSDETYTKLSDAYGKFFVDTMVANLKLSTDAKVAEFNSNMSAAEKQAFDAVSDIVGGTEGWGKLEAFAATLPDEAIDAFNEAMQSGNPTFQRYAVQAMVGQMNQSETYVEEKGLVLEEAKGGLVQTQTMLSDIEYRELIATGEYYKDAAKYDAMRRSGMQAGI